MRYDQLQKFIDNGGAVSCDRPIRTAEPTSPDHKHRVGQAAQHMVAADILMRGYSCSISAEALPYDLIADIGGLRRIQVKARAFAQYRGKQAKTPFYMFMQLFPEKNDLFAFVALPTRMIIYRSAASIQVTGLGIAADEFTAHETERSWAEIISSLT